MPENIAYFCMEYGLNPNLKIYAGGLGILAGDTLKASRDLRESVTGIGILWTTGYTSQKIKNGKPEDSFEEHVYNFLEDTGISFEVAVSEESVRCKVYRTQQFHNSPLYLIDTDVGGNSEKWKGATDRLYSGDWEEYLLQQILLGKAGFKLVEVLDTEPDFYHLNESDSMFVGMEILRDEMKDGEFEEALDGARKKIRFTTHTPIGAGNPKYKYCDLKKAGVLGDFTRDDLERLGGEPFNLSLAGLRLAGKANAVSERHKEIARDIWSGYDGVPEIIGITNGVHMVTWQSEEIRSAKSRKELWRRHMLEKEKLIQVLDLDLDPDKPLLGFARRFPGYKRPKLFFWDESRAKELLEGVNIVFGGKAHPNDEMGKKLISDIVEYSKKYSSVEWVENYGIACAKLLTKGCDVWLSCPVPKREACSTSVIKAASNGLLNLSTLDGWWWEACEHGTNGWQFGGGDVMDSREEQDEHDAQALYEVIENQVIPTYRNREKWLEMMEKSIDTAQRYSAHEMLKNYKKKLWIR